uniref:Uncharacterized protein n=1 Tax=Solanum lycopersicum TaxID=4081 RepID=A0A3Q7EKN6_SOLLC
MSPFFTLNPSGKKTSTYLQSVIALALSNAALKFLPCSFEPHMLSSSTPKATLNTESRVAFMNRSYIDKTRITSLHKMKFKKMMYLAIVVKVCFENVLNVSRVRSINLIPERANQSVSLVLASKISHEMVQPVEVDELIENGATDWM